MCFVADSSSVRLAGLEGLGSMASSFDRAAVESQILPVLLQVYAHRKVSVHPVCTGDIFMYIALSLQL